MSIFKKNSDKGLTDKVYKVPNCVQDTIPISRISEEGIFELERKEGFRQFDKAYLFDDINYSEQTELEKLDTAKKYSNLLKSMNTSFKIITSNHYVDLEKLKSDILLKPVSDSVKELADSYNALTMERLKSGKGGLRQSRYFIVRCTEPDFPSARNYFNHAEYNFNAAFNVLGSRLIPLNACERLRTLHSFYRMGEEESFSFDWNEYLNLKRDWRNDIINTMIREHEDYLDMGQGKYACTMFIRRFPHSLTDKFLENLMNLNFPLTFCMDFEPIDQSYAYKQVRNKLMMVESAIYKEQQFKNDHMDFSTDLNYERLQQKEDTKRRLDKMTSEDEHMLYAGFTVLFRADSMDQLKLCEDRIRKIGSDAGCDMDIYSGRQLDAMENTLPTGARFIDNMRSITTDEVSVLMPFNVQEMRDKEGFCYGVNQVSKNLIIGNRKFLKNPNGMVFGVSGAGKSFNEKVEMGQVLSFTHDDVIVVDPMNEYMDIAKKWNGAYVNLVMSEQNKYFINPFNVNSYIPDRVQFVNEKSEFALAFMEQVLKPEVLNGKHMAIIEHAVNGLYKDFFERYDKLSGRKKDKLDSPTLKDIWEYIKANEDSCVEKDQIVDRLETYAVGNKSIFAHQQSVPEDNRFTVFGFKQLGATMKTIAMLVMIESIRAQIIYNERHTDKSTWIYIDEIHELWADKYSTEALETMWREVRKQRGICTGMTQNLKDTNKNIHTENSIVNSEFIVLLSQGKNSLDEVSDLFDLTETQVKKINDADRGTGMIRFGSVWIPFDNTVSKDSEFYKLFNTEMYADL